MAKKNWVMENKMGIFWGAIAAAVLEVFWSSNGVVQWLFFPKPWLLSLVSQPAGGIVDWLIILIWGGLIGMLIEMIIDRLS